MIVESWPWKQQLLKDANLIDRWASKAFTRRSFHLEQKVFLSAYAMRKLFEAEKLTSKLDDLNVKAERFSLLPSKQPDWWTRFNFHEVFDLNAPEKCTVGVSKILNLFIHSRVFAEAVYSEADLRVGGFFVNSDFHENTLWHISVSEFTSLMRIVGNDDVTSARVVIHPTTHKHLSWRGDGDHPPYMTARLQRFLKENKT